MSFVYPTRRNFQNLTRSGDEAEETLPPPLRTLGLERLDPARCDHEDPRTFSPIRKRNVTYALDGMARDRCAVVRAPERPRRREQEPQDIVDLGRGPDGGTCRPPRRLLLDRDRGQDVFDEIHVGAFEALEVLARVRGHGLDEPTLTLRIERVEGERGFSGARGAGDDGERADGNGARHVLQIVRARADDRDRARPPCGPGPPRHREKTASWFMPKRKRR